MTTAEAKSESVFTVVIAFGANLLIAIAKTVAALLTGSASMVAEAAHSWADTGNEVFLLIAERRSVRPRDERHPLGYGKDAYIWSMFAAFGLFTAGAVVSVQHGIQELVEPEHTGDYLIAYLVIGVAFLLEGFSFLRAWRQARSIAAERDRSVLAHVRETSNPTLRAVFAEDAAALIGLVLAFAGILLHQLTGNPVFDAAGSIAVGVLLGVVAVVLIRRNREFLLGQELDAQTQQRILDQLRAHDDIERVTYLHVEFIGPSQVLLIAAVDLVGNLREDKVGEHLRRIARDLEAQDYVGQAALTLSAPDDPDLLTMTP
jgi:cation diffusion facilitator family transporter